MYVELWPMAKFVVKQSSKAHGPLVNIIKLPTTEERYLVVFEV